MAENPIDFAKLEAAVKDACKDKVYIQSPMGSDQGFSSISLSMNEIYVPKDKKPRGSLAHISTSIYHSEKSYGNRTTSWHEPIRTARADAQLLCLLWNNAAELIRLAKLGQTVDTAIKTSAIA